MPVKTIGFGVLYIHRECPICLSIFRLETIKKAINTPAKMRLIIKDVESLSSEERLRLWGYRLTEYGIVHRVTVPLLVIYCVDETTGEWIPIYKKEWRPLMGPFLSEADIREMLALITSFQWECVRKSGSHIGESGEEEVQRKARKRRNS
ncbi:hypothetical protein QIT50_gp05 [Pyrobaculum spherical virus 2]|uniref:Uncharacterized protein n=1 Tax=Pyrobaculum spherical virus 2 TaxID=2730632 RepID=A0A6M3VXS4_9VIRU|nr:hypothetical protein QIT50_gp05 [Pyrobaculum spherical virus 2]QJF12417.1 hypothetical protein PSV2_gp05 [Pyrobaculum spherical virus 2]